MVNARTLDGHHRRHTGRMLPRPCRVAPCAPLTAEQSSASALHRSRAAAGVPSATSCCIWPAEPHPVRVSLSQAELLPERPTGRVKPRPSCHAPPPGNIDSTVELRLAESCFNRSLLQRPRHATLCLVRMRRRRQSCAAPCAYESKSTGMPGHHGRRTPPLLSLQ